MKNDNVKLKIKDAKGFTLIEILIAATIFVIVIVAASAIFSQATGMGAKVEASKKTQEAGRIIMERLVREIKTAKGQTVGGTASCPIYNFAKLTMAGACPDSNMSFDSDSAGVNIDKQFFKISHLQEDGTNRPFTLAYTKTSSTSRELDLSYRETGASWNKLNPDDVKIDRIYMAGYYSITLGGEIQQPYMSIILTLKNTGADQKFKDEYTLQTTVTMDNLAR